MLRVACFAALAASASALVAPPARGAAALSSRLAPLEVQKGSIVRIMRPESCAAASETLRGALRRSGFTRRASFRPKPLPPFLVIQEKGNNGVSTGCLAARQVPRVQPFLRGENEYLEFSRSENAPQSAVENVVGFNNPPGAVGIPSHDLAGTRSIFSSCSSL